MCTVTWLRRPDGYELLFNRDELKSRAEAEPPARRERDGTAWLAPVDGEAGGTWIAANEHGVTLGLLNGFRARDEAARDWTSRGKLVDDLAVVRGRDELEARLRGLDLDPYRSFRLLVLEPGADALVAEWDRVTLEVDRDAEGRRPLVSSSFEETDVGRARRAEFSRIAGSAAPEARPTLDDLLAFHRSTTNGPSAYSVSMERPEAATRSFTRVQVSAESVVMRYAPGPPHAPGPESVARLPRAGAAARDRAGRE